MKPELVGNEGMRKLRSKIAYFTSRFSGKTCMRISIYACVVTFGAQLFNIDGINRNFLTGLSVTYLVGVLLIAGLLFSRGRLRTAFRRAESGVSTGINTSNVMPMLFVLLPTGVVLNYGAINQDILRLQDIMKILLVAGGLSFATIVLLPNLMRGLLDKTASMAFGLALCVAYVYMPTLAREFSWTDHGPFQMLGPAMLVLHLVCYVLIRKAPEFLAVFSVLYFTVIPSLAYFDHQVTNSTASAGHTRIESPADRFLAHLELARKPDIYLLTYDAYVGNETMLAYGIDNAAQEQKLENLGFEIYPEVYSVSAFSLSTMGAVLHASDSSVLSHDGNTGWSAKSNVIRRISTSGFGAVVSFLNDQGYRTYNITGSGFFNKEKVSNYAYAYGIEGSLGDGAWIILTAIALGEFKFDVKAREFEFGSQAVENAKAEVFGALPSEPKFLYMHSGPGHSQNSGKCRPNETELFAERLTRFNQIMIADIEQILASGRESIIIVNGDHGPSLTGNCMALKGTEAMEVTRLDLQDRFGTFLAIRWPDTLAHDVRELIVLQDLFPVVFENLAANRPTSLYRLNSTTDAWNKQNYIKKGQIVYGKDAGHPLFEGTGESASGAKSETKREGYLVSAAVTAVDYVNLSSQYYARGKYQKSIEANEKALGLDPASAGAYNNICVSNIQLKRWDRAISACEKAIALNPDVKLFRNNLAWAQREEAKH